MQEPGRGVGNSFQPAIDASRESLTNYVIAPSTKMKITMKTLAIYINGLPVPFYVGRKKIACYARLKRIPSIPSSDVPCHMHREKGIKIY